MAYTAYQIVTGQGPEGIAAAVTEAIADGWQPLGAVRHTGIANYAQAMVKGTADSGGSSDSYTLPAATATEIGGVKMAANQANAGSSSATDVTTLVTDFNTLATKYNGLLSALEAAGIMVGSS